MAGQKPINTSSGQSGAFDNHLTEDVNGLHKQPNQWSHARNAVNNTTIGDVGELSNEASNYLCSSAPYTIIGGIHLGGDAWAVFSTNNTDSEIGIFLEDTCTYTVAANAQCLNFSLDKLIIGVGRTTADCGRQVYWDDGVNPTRLLNLDDIPWIQDCNIVDSCNICVDTTELDCEKLRLAPIVKDLAFRVERGNASGQLINGNYYVVGAYLVNGQRVTDYSLPSNVQGVFTHDNVASSLDIYIDEADTEFDEFELILVQFANFNTVARRIGVYSTRQDKITLDQIDESLPTIDPGSLLIQNNVADRSDGVFRNGEYLIRSGPTQKFDFNYQPLANQINASWVSIEYDAEYYRQGGHNTGYMRDEVYPFFIRWVFNTGDKSKSYHIPGRGSIASDITPISGPDVVAGDDPINWKVYNTASITAGYPGAGTTLADGGLLLGGGKMGYWESSEIYDDDKPQIWNANTGNPAHNLCGKPIRHHKFPDNALDAGPDMITNHYHPTDGTKIRVMSVQFDNIQPPVDNDGVPLANVVGYEILRGSREGNKTILAKGMINNLRQYLTADKDPQKTFLYPNYPYNPTAKDENYHNGDYIVDHFLGVLSTTYKGPGLLESANAQLNDLDWNSFLEDDYPLGAPYSNVDGENYFQDPSCGNIMKDMVTFHSPETNFRHPFLSAKELKVYGELHGTMTGRFQFPKDHPRHKFITNTSFLVSAIVGIGYAMISTEGKKSTAHASPQTDFGGTNASFGAVIGSTGLFGPSAVAAATQIAANATASVTTKIINKVLSTSMLSMVMNMGGINSNAIRDTALNTTGELAGAVGGTGSQKSFSREESAWESTPGALRVLQGIPTFLSYWAEGIDKMLNIIYAFTPYRQYALQQVSHCFYDGFAAPDIGDIRRGIANQNYLNPELQDFAGDFRINNIYRSKTVALKLDSGLAFPYKRVDNSQAIFSDVWDRVTDDKEWSDDQYINSSFNRNASSHYVAMKQRLDNQYGQLSGINQVPVSTDSTPLSQTKSDVLFNGDVYIGRYTEKNTMFFFYDWLKDQPDGHEFNYKLRKMVTHPRFWMDTDPFDVGEFVRSLGSVFELHADAPQGFDPFMLANPALVPLPPTPVPIPALCECGNLNNCLLDTGDLADVCELEEEVAQLAIYLDFLNDCACFVNDGDGGCNEDLDQDDPGGPLGGYVYNPATGEGCLPGFDFPYDGETLGCTVCPDWKSIVDVTFPLPSPGTTNESAAQYLDDNKGKWARKIKRVQRRLQRKQKKLNRINNRLYDEYLDGLDGDQEGFFGDLVDGIITPGDKFGFDMRDPGKFRLAVKEAYMYLFNSGVRDFFVESEINLDYRDWGETIPERHYDHIEYTNLKDIFSTDWIKVGNHYKYDYSLSVSKLFNNFVSWGSLQDRTYDPELAETCYTYKPKRMMYSLPQSLENRKDNWRVFLPLNYKDFNSEIVNVKPIAKSGAIILFKSQSPQQFPGQDELQTSDGSKITIGDGGLFTRPLQNLANADYPHEFGSCQNRLSAANTPAGLFYVSQNQGKVFQVGQGLAEISNAGMKWWFANYLPYKLTEDFPDYALQDNPVNGIGCQTIYDNKNEIVFFCKKDYAVRKDIADVVTYNVETGLFKVNGYLTVELGDPAYFQSASWTVSYDPKSQGWIGYHDWHPDLVIPSKKTYMTTKGKGLWVHADRTDSYCNFYGVDYPFEVEYALHTQNIVNTLRNVQYTMEVYIYADNGTDRFHVLDFNFDEAVVYNSEQCSGLLRLNLTPKNNAPEIVNYPIINTTNIDILFAKEEQKYRFNQFWDITDDRGEFNPSAQRTIFNTEANGYIRNLNPNNLNYDKFELERKKFRHYKNTVLLRRLVSGNKNMIVATAVQMNLNSPR